MRALRMTSWNHEPSLADVPAPEAGPGQAVLTMGGAGVCHSDLHVLYEFPAGAMPWTLPMTLGHENAGWVHQLGPGSVGLEVGQPVAVYGPWGCGRCRACALGEENYCQNAALGTPVGGLGADGGMAEFMLVPGLRHLVPLPDTVGPADAAPLTDAALTPYHAIARARRLLVPGSTAVVIGIGGLGHLAIQILRATTEARVVAVDQRPDALELAKACGADDVVLAGDSPAEAIRDVTKGRGAQAVFDMVGLDSTLELAGRAVSVNGHIGLVGLGGGDPARLAHGPAVRSVGGIDLLGHASRAPRGPGAGRTWGLEGPHHHLPAGPGGGGVRSRPPGARHRPSGGRAMTGPVIGLDGLRLADEPLAGGKGANLGELVRAGLPVPPGFVITAPAFLAAMDERRSPSAARRPGGGGRSR